MASNSLPTARAGVLPEYLLADVIGFRFLAGHLPTLVIQHLGYQRQLGSGAFVNERGGAQEVQVDDYSQTFYLHLFCTRSMVVMLRHFLGTFLPGRRDSFSFACHRFNLTSYR